MRSGVHVTEQRYAWGMAWACLEVMAGAVSAQGSQTPGTAIPAESSARARGSICASEYRAFAADADPASKAAMGERQAALQTRFGLDQMMVDSLAMSTLSNLPAVLTEEHVGRLAACDREFGFSPVTTLVGGKLSIRQIADLTCASAYWLHGAATPAEQQQALQRANHAILQHLAANPGDDRARTEQRVMAEGQARGQRIQSGAEKVEAWRDDLLACEGKYRFAQPAVAVPTAKPAPAVPPPDTRSPAQLYAAGQNKFLKGERPEKLDLYRRACAGGHQPACRDYGMELRFSANEPAVREAIWGLDKACQARDAEACVEVGKLRDPTNPFAGAKALKDWAGAEANYRQACTTLGDSDACEPLAELLRASRNPQPKAAEAKALLRKLCDGGRTDICAKLATEALKGQ
jgi:hypothetical protein